MPAPAAARSVVTCAESRRPESGCRVTALGVAGRSTTTRTASSCSAANEVHGPRIRLCTRSSRSLGRNPSRRTGAVRILLHATVVGPTSISSPPCARDADDWKALRDQSGRGLGARFADLGERSARRRPVVGTGRAPARWCASHRGSQRTRDPSYRRRRLTCRKPSRSGHRTPASTAAACRRLSRAQSTMSGVRRVAASRWTSTRLEPLPDNCCESISCTTSTCLASVAGLRSDSRVITSSRRLKFPNASSPMTIGCVHNRRTGPTRRWPRRPTRRRVAHRRCHRPGFTRRRLDPGTGHVLSGSVRPSCSASQTGSPIGSSRPTGPPMRMRRPALLSSCRSCGPGRNASTSSSTSARGTLTSDGVRGGYDGAGWVSGSIAGDAAELTSGRLASR
jgi:hypothetical protein